MVESQPLLRNSVLSCRHEQARVSQGSRGTARSTNSYFHRRCRCPPVGDRLPIEAIFRRIVFIPRPREEELHNREAVQPASLYCGPRTGPLTEHLGKSDMGIGKIWPSVVY